MKYRSIWYFVSPNNTEKLAPAMQIFQRQSEIFSVGVDWHEACKMFSTINS